MYGATERMFLLIEHHGLPVVTSTDETSTRRDFKSAWKGCPPEIQFQETCPVAPSKKRIHMRFFDVFVFDREDKDVMGVWYSDRMPISVLTTFFLSALITLGMVHVTALHFFLYWKYLWLDIPVHFLGGITVALGVMLMVRVLFPRWCRYVTAHTIVFIVVIIGVFWEVFEYGIGVPIDAEGFVVDTAIDLLMDVCGAFVGYGLNEQLKKM